MKDSQIDRLRFSNTCLEEPPNLIDTLYAFGNAANESELLVSPRDRYPKLLKKFRRYSLLTG